jgi:predicted CXXCH cytochrome family protein
LRTRTAKALAQRIDLNYFKRQHPARRWRTILSVLVPLLGLAWLGGMAAAGSRAPYSSGPVSTAHAFAEQKCEVCHVPTESLRAHVGEPACLTCHDAPAHTTAATAGLTTPSCATCHREHQGRVSLTATADTFCVDCHGDLPGAGEPAATQPPPPRRVIPPPLQRQPAVPPGTDTNLRQMERAIYGRIAAFPAGHPEFITSREGYEDRGTVAFNHEVHASVDLRGPAGPETLECSTCHKPEIARVGARQRLATGLMTPVNYEQNCARCHQLYFDERIAATAPHEEPAVVREFVERAFREHIAANPGDINKPDGPARRIPLNFPRPVEPPARTPAEWVVRRTIQADRVLQRTCSGCHGAPIHISSALVYRPASITRHWMPMATFDHGPHAMVTCTSCHAAEQSRLSSDVLMPSVATCATCHAPDKGASSTCATCHAYHDWTKAQPVKPQFRVSDFQ